MTPTTPTSAPQATDTHASGETQGQSAAPAGFSELIRQVSEIDARVRPQALFDRHATPTHVKLDNFERYVRRQALSRLLARYELFKMTMDVKGSIVECGVHHGGGLFAWAKLSAALEPMAIHRKVIGFDTFEGFPEVAGADAAAHAANPELRKGGFAAASGTFEELIECTAEFDGNRFLNQFPKVELVRGDATKTIPAYVAENSHLLVSILFLDFDIYAPTKVALEHLLRRVPKGGIVAFDEINNAAWKGETVAMMEVLGSLNSYAVQKFPFDPNIAYIRL